MEEAGRRGSRPLAGANTSTSIKCGRWNPTAEQVRVQMDLFRAGLRTPSTGQIQWISSHLSNLGKIESKNVFYWFQNHKARERLHHSLTHTNRRRRLPPPPPPPPALPSSSSSSSSSPAGVWTNNGEEVPKRSGGMIVKTEKTLELFPLTSSSSSSSNFGFGFALANCEGQFREQASRSGSDQLRSVVNEEDVPQLDLTVPTAF